MDAKIWREILYFSILIIPFKVLVQTYHSILPDTISYMQPTT